MNDPLESCYGVDVKLLTLAGDPPHYGQLSTTLPVSEGTLRVPAD